MTRASHLAWSAALIAALFIGCDDGESGGSGPDPDFGGALRDGTPEPEGQPEPEPEVTPDAGPVIDAGPQVDQGPEVDMAPPPECMLGEVRECAAGGGCAGTESCVAGQWGPCEPPPEICNGQDDDCDAITDEGFVGLGATCAVGEGACETNGRQVCNPAGDGVICNASPGAAGVEACNNVDDDCDGSTDEDFDVGGACDLGVGACAAQGQLICDANGEIVCGGARIPPERETCNAIDDDCDGLTDEGFDVGAPCTAGVGECAVEDEIACDDAGGAICGAAAAAPDAEACNGLDDDCDGVTDEDFGVGEACEAGLGACAAEGALVCARDGQIVCDAAPGAPAEERCNAIDDDCDGQTDEGFDVGGACQIGEGACVGQGVFACGPDGGLTCVGQGGGGDPEVCNGQDDDCDGTIDEAIDGGACVVDDPECPAPGVEVCVNGALQCEPLGGGVGVDLGDGADGELIVAGGQVVVLDRPAYAFTRLQVAANGRLEVAPYDPATGTGGQVDIRVQGQAIIEAGGSIELSSRGWPGAPPNPKVVRNYLNEWTNGGGSTGYHGAGPSAGQGGWAAPQQVVGSGGGGGHVSPGGNGTLCGPDARANYSVFDVNTGVPIPIPNPPPNFSMGGAAQADPPVLSMGSGGGGGGNNYDGGPGGVGGAGGPGGGAIRLTAGQLTVAGQIVANGGAGGVGVGGSFLGGGGGGAGGAIHLVGARVDFTGQLLAAGGVGGVGQAGSTGGAGGAGWIRISAGELRGGGRADPPAIDEQIVVCGGEEPPVVEGPAVFEFTGDVQRFEVPAGIREISIEAWGAQGGSTESCVDDEMSQDDGGLGGRASGRLAVEPGQVLTVRVGGQPALVFGVGGPGGYNGGGGWGQYGGGGGGASDVRRGGDGLEHRVIVAGGGGGGNTGCPDHGTGGPGGGFVGGAGISLQNFIPGGAGTQNGGGAAGDMCLPGALGRGGDNPDYHMAGGGGGYYGGGCAYAAGGGGGSSFVGGVLEGATEAGARLGNGRVVIHY